MDRSISEDTDFFMKARNRGGEALTGADVYSSVDKPQQKGEIEV